MTSSSPVDTSAGELLRERDRVVARLTSMPVDRIPQDAVRRTAQHLEDLAAAARQVPPRAVPELAAYALGDQLTVLVGEIAALAAAEQATAAARAALEQLRAELSASLDSR
jgi:hypothetical protein